eukprot:278580-Prymnesium_polylepis.2
MGVLHQAVPVDRERELHDHAAPDDVVIDRDHVRQRAHGEARLPEPGVAHEELPAVTGIRARAQAPPQSHSEPRGSV